jgi:hypothetical protein
MHKNQARYFKNGTRYDGSTHKMPNGDLHTGAKHTKNSEKVYHYSELPSAAAKTKARKRT